ncbi:MAG: glutamine-hydrolyzing GMP synthase subunit GuaA [Thermoplasmata archaeon HGW-Thermoplasmata-1]|nr:MAG: glutamine-hydrolyzing GMP synthase subunit GuaA [Thermoplasmata archaeon HGW-Thermoplasmata-1]
MFNAQTFIEEAIAGVKAKVKPGETAIIACSGGVDSTVAAAIVKEAVGDQLTAVYVDTGYMRKNESAEVRAMYAKMGLNLIFVDASQEYYEALAGVTEPEQKRKIIGGMFIRIFEREAKKSGAKYLVQGTIAPDWIESGGELRDVIKSHHNVGGLPKDMKLELIEPLYHLYKDEVRKVARELKLEIAERQPFPGPGLAIRVMGEASPERTGIVREACHIVETEIDRAVNLGKMERPWQYFAVLLPVKTVGVHGDIRAYGYTIAVRAVESLDAMTATYSDIPHDVLERISIKITNTIGDNINRVVYDITHKPPGTVEWE